MAAARPSHALILTAGLGMRLRPLTLVRAKPAIPVAGVPIIRRIIRWLVDSGVPDITLNLHHRPATLTAVVGDGSDMHARVRYSWEPTILGSAGGPRQALDIVGADPFYILNGDTLTDVDLEALAADHARSGALVTMALVPNEQPERYGGITLNADGGVTGVVPRGPRAEGSLHFIGAQIAHRRAFSELPLSRPAASIGGIYDSLFNLHGGAIRGFVTRAGFWDIGTVADYWETSMSLAQADQLGRAENVREFSRPNVTNTIVWDDVQIDSGATLDECIVTDGVRVQAGATYRRMILLRGAHGETVASPLVMD